MDRRNPVYGKAVMDIDMGHVHALFLVNDLHPGILILLCHSLIQLLDIGHELGHHLLQIFQRPFFERLRKNRVIGVGAGLTYHLDCLIHGKSLFLHQNADQLRYDHGRMGVIDLDHRMVVHFSEIVFLFLHLVQDQLGGVAYHKILLIDTQKVARLIRIIRIQEQGEILLDLGLVKIDPVLHDALIQRLNIEEAQLVHTAVISGHVNVI